MRIRPISLAIATLAAALACGGGDTGKTPGGTTGPATPVVTTVIVSPPSVQLEIGATQPFTADVRDQLGAVMTGQSVAWSTSSSSVATVSAAGVVTALAAGTAQINATVGSKVGSSTVTITPTAVASVVIGGSGGTLTAGQTIPLSAVTKDKGGNTLAGRVVTWKSSNTLVATIDNAGVLTALSAGSTTITATSETISATLTLTVAAPAGSLAPTVSSIAPATMTPGATVTITGANFGTTAALNQVFISGVKASVVTAAPTQLTVTVPAGVPCQATQQVNVDVVTVGGSVTAKQLLQVSTSRPLAVGQNFLAGGAGIACNELPTAGTYLISVFNASPTFSSVASVELKGVGAAGSASLSSAASASRLIVPAARPRASVVSAATASAESEHVRWYEQQLAVVRNFRHQRAPGVSRSVIGGASTVARSAAAVPLTVGAAATINYTYNGCGTSAPQITARVVYVGPKVVVLEDNGAPLAGKIDADMISMAKDFEDTSFPILTKYFGNPLALDAQTDNNGRIIMMFTQRVNNSGSNLLGFVNPCDLYATTFSGNSKSNMAEIFYARAVTDTTPGATSLNSRGTWKRQMPGTLIHETKHIVSAAEREATPVLTHDEETWLEEAEAQLAAELYGRAIHNNTWRSNAGYTGTLDCEVRPNTAGCGGGVIVMLNHFSWLSDFLASFETKSIVRAAGDGSNDDTMYGSSWLFTRWLTDTYGGTDEAAFTKALTLNYTSFGVDNVTSLTGKTWPELLSQFTLMLAADDNAGVPAAFQEPSWALQTVWTGYNTDFPSSWPSTFFSPRIATFGSTFFMPSQSLHGGGAMVVRLNAGGTGPQLLDLHDSQGNPLPAGTTVGISVLRIQ